MTFDAGDYGEGCGHSYYERGCLMCLAQTTVYAWVAITNLLPPFIARATERYCPDCDGKIDRVEAPVGYVGAPDGKVMDGRGDWPTWTHHATDCPLRLCAAALELP